MKYLGIAEACDVEKVDGTAERSLECLCACVRACMLVCVRACNGARVCQCGPAVQSAGDI